MGTRESAVRLLYHMILTLDTYRNRIMATWIAELVFGEHTSVIPSNTSAEAES